MSTSYPTVNISLKTLLQECAKNKDLQEDMFFDFRLMSREHVHQVFKYKKFNDDFTDFLTCYNDGSSVVGYVRASYDEFLEKLMIILGVEGHHKDDEELTFECEKRIARLRQITSEGELLGEFPVIYQDLVDSRRYIEEIKALKRLDPVNADTYEEEEHYYFGCALKHRLDRFLETQSEFYRRLVHQRQEYKELIESKSYNSYIREKIDVNKMTLYVVWEYLMVCEGTRDTNTIKKYLALVEKYFKSPYAQDKSSRITLKGQDVSYYTVLVKYNEMKEKLKGEKIALPWEIVPKGKVPRKVIQPLSENPRPEIFSLEETERLRAKGQEKQEFYENSGYELFAEGKTQYRGYVGYIYPNGKVLLDREYDDSNPRSAEKNAIYIMDLENFEELSQLDKQALQKHPQVQRMIHSSTWRERARKIIDEKVPEEKQEKATQLIKQYRDQ